MKKQKEFYSFPIFDILGDYAEIPSSSPDFLAKMTNAFFCQFEDSLYILLLTIDNKTCAHFFVCVSNLDKELIAMYKGFIYGYLSRES